MDKLIVRNSLGEILREDKRSEYDIGITESIFLLNVAYSISPTMISKQLGILIRNLNTNEINYCIPKVAAQISKVMREYGYEKIVRYEKEFDENLSEMENMINFFSKGMKMNSMEINDIYTFIYAKLMYHNQRLDKKIVLSVEDDFKNIEEYSNKLAKRICSNFIVLEIKNYNKLYSIFNEYYFLDKDVVRMNWSVKKFINNFVKLMNIIFLEIDSHNDETYFNFSICEFEKYKFDIYKFAAFYDGYYHNCYQDKNISKYLQKIDSNFIDSYIKNNKQNLNNLLFITSKLYIEDDKFYEFNYREYNLNLISILELLLVDSKDEKNITNKFVKNIMICLSINDCKLDFSKEKIILKYIYSYRSCILHGNYSGYTNAMGNLEEKLEYNPMYYEKSKFDTIDWLISKKLNFYLRNVFKVISWNHTIVDILKN